jgi:hypothetical protein
MADFDSVAIVPPVPTESSVMVVFPTMEETPIEEAPVTEEHPMSETPMEAPSAGETPRESGYQEPQPGPML